jgi:3-hydroxyacyl-[acyl-carrier-protein] dehydratase
MAADLSEQGITVDYEQIIRMIPHRYPFLLVDRVKEMYAGKSAVGIKNVTINEPFFPGHFPARPVMPGVLIIESMAQTSGILVVHTLGASGEGKLVYFMSIDNTKFRRPVTPGDQLHVHVEVLQHRKNVWKFRGKAYVDGVLVAEADFAAMIVDP